ncbi:11864_t:CDS:2, partial [Cetraspora pellucida]
MMSLPNGHLMDDHKPGLGSGQLFLLEALSTFLLIIVEEHQ